jgi:hypothetical protein
MKFARNKTMATAFAFVMILTIAMIAALPIVSARTIRVWMYINLAPNPTGVGQATTLITWVSQNTPTAMGQMGERWQNITITVTNPSNVKSTLGPYKADPVGFVFTFFTPDATGNWTFQSHFPGQTLANGDFYPAADSKVVTLVVQQNPVEPIEGVPYTDDYWTRPIYGENRDWWPKTGNWLMPAVDNTFRFFDQGSAFAPYNDAPDSPHIMWTHPITFGGLIGGEYTSTSYYSGMSYEMKLYPPCVINGLYYYNLFPGGIGAPPGYAVLDLRTGEELWRNEEVRIDIGQIYNYDSPNQHGGQAYLWSLGSTYKMYDAWTGKFILEIVNVTAGTPRFDNFGGLLTYQFTADGNLSLWNASKCIGPLGAPGTTEGSQWRPWITGATPINWSRGVEWSVPYINRGGIYSIASGIVDPDVLVAYVYSPGPGFYVSSGGWFVNVGFSTKTGQELWWANRTMQDQTYFVWQMLDYSHVGDKEAGVYTYHVRDQLVSYGFNIDTGAQIWVTPPLEDAWGEFPSGQITAYGKYYLAAWDGKVHCYDITDGSLEWTYFSGNAGLDTPYGHWPFYSGIMIADDKVFASTGEHSPATPYWRGEKLHVIDAKTGEGLWKISGWFISHGNIVADGYFVGLNVYDNQLYCFGKGPSATTVSLPQTTVANGSSVLIQGTVTDQSPGSKAKGTPCVSDASMSKWMEYLFMQQPCPTDVTGVPVKLEAFGADGSYKEIGTVTSDAYGNFMSTWTPPDEGLYTIMATFAGSKSYGRSYAATGLSVGPAPAAPPEPVEIPAYPDYTPMLAAILVVGIVAIIIGIIILLRKK